MESSDITLETLLGGALAERFEHELRRVLKNIQDPNTAAKTKRVITLKLVLTPNEGREVAGLSVCCSSKLAPPRDLETQLFMAVTRSGEVRVCENNPRQLGLSFDDPAPDNVEPLKKEAAGQ